MLKFSADGGPRVTVARRIVQPYSVTVDWSGNVYFYGKTFDAGSNSKLVKIPVGGGPPEELWSDTLHHDRDIAVDFKANLYLLGENPARVLDLPANGGSPTSFDRQVTVARTKSPLDVALAPQPVGPYVHKIPDLVGWVHGAAAEGGNGWLVIGKRFIPIPPRSPLMDIIAHAAAPYAARAVEDVEIAGRPDRLQFR